MEEKNNSQLRDNPKDKCDKNNPNDPHYEDRDKGDYNSSCVWIWDIGRKAGETK